MKKILSIVALLVVVIAIITSQILLIHCPHKLAFNAGTYEVQVDGHNDIIRVGVTFSDSSIVAINVLEQHETPQIGAIVFDKLIPEIKDKIGRASCRERV